MARKIHPSAVIKNLPDEDQAALYDFLSSKTIVEGKPRGKTLAEGVAWLFSNNGLRISDSSLSDWRGWYEMSLEVGSWENDAKEFKAMLVNTGTDDDLAAKIAEARFLCQAAKKNDAETYVKVMGVIERYKSRKAAEKQHGDKMAVKTKELAQRDRALQQAEKKLSIAEGKLKAVAEKLDELRDPAKADDKEMRQRIMDEVDRAMGIKKS